MAYLLDDWYISVCEPIRDFQNKIVAMLYVGILETKCAAPKERLILLFMLGMLVSVGISSFLSLKFIKKDFWKDIKSGQKQKSIMQSYSKFETFLEMGFMVGLIVNRL